MNILIFGGQGSGKSTAGKYLAQKLSVPYINTGDLFRHLEGEKSEKGEKIRVLMQSGSLIPDDLAISCIKDHLEEFDTGKGMILDGYPRTVYQAERIPFKIDRVLFIEVPHNVAVERLSERGRYDDTPELIKKRLDLYKEKTEPMLAFFREKGIPVEEVDNSGSLEELEKKLHDILPELDG